MPALILRNLHALTGVSTSPAPVMQNPQHHIDRMLSCEVDTKATFTMTMRSITLTKSSRNYWGSSYEESLPKRAMMSLHILALPDQ